jgi:hypothetical protein
MQLLGRGSDLAPVAPGIAIPSFELAEGIPAHPGTDMERLNKAADLIGASRRFLISRTSKTLDAGKRVSCNLDWLVGCLERRPA